MAEMLLTRRAAGCALVLAVALCAVAAPLLSGYPPDGSSVESLAPPSAVHRFGTDDLGRDVLARVLFGARVSLLIGPCAALLATAIGLPLGLLGGFLRGLPALVIVQLIDLCIALPGLVLALFITVMVGPSLRNIILVLGVVMWPTMARLVRGQAMDVAVKPYVEAARATGCGTTRILVRHVWPNIMRTVAAQYATTVAFAIFTAASLSFLGLGIPPPTPDLGGMVRGGFQFLTLNPMASLAPGAVVGVMVSGFYLIGSSVD
ncbi:MAG: ABC transporter permease [Acidisphaera sp.]|nr:ABC transporter permease [Acidisphaera sp.]